MPVTTGNSWYRDISYATVTYFALSCPTSFFILILLLILMLVLIHPPASFVSSITYSSTPSYFPLSLFVCNLQFVPSEMKNQKYFNLKVTRTFFSLHPHPLATLSLHQTLWSDYNCVLFAPRADGKRMKFNQNFTRQKQRTSSLSDRLIWP